MKVKNSSHLQSLTLLLRSGIKNSSGPNEGCDPRYVFVPSVTYLCTRKPQWRRRHKKRKQTNTPGLPLLISARINESGLLETLRLIENPVSRPSASPCGTHSTRQVIAESKLAIPLNEQKDHYDFDFRLNRQIEDISLIVSARESRSDSGRLRNPRQRQLVQSTRLQERFDDTRNSTNDSPDVVDTNGNVSVKRSLRLSVDRESQLDCGIPTRRVIGNYVSEGRPIDRQKRTSETISDTAAHRLEESYMRFSDEDNDRISLHTGLSRLLSSMISHISSTFSLSIASSKISEKPKKSKTQLKETSSEKVFYMNVSYVRESPSELLSIRKIFSAGNHLECDSSVSSECDSDKKDQKIMELLNMNSRHKGTVSRMEILCNKNTHPIYPRSITCLSVQMTDFVDRELPVESRRIMDYPSILFSLPYKRDISTDTSDLIASNGATEFSKNLASNVGLNLSAIIGFIRPNQKILDFNRPTQMDSILKQSSIADRNIVTNSGLRRSVENIRNLRRSNNDGKSNVITENINLFRIDTETFGEYESICIEMNDCDVDVEEMAMFKSTNPKLIATSQLQDGYPACPGIGKRCLICGRTKINNPRYLRPVCRVKDVTSTSRLENDPWINVINRAGLWGNPSSGSKKIAKGQ